MRVLSASWRDGVARPSRGARGLKLNTYKAAQSSGVSRAPPGARVG